MAPLNDWQDRFIPFHLKRRGYRIAFNCTAHVCPTGFGILILIPICHPYCAGNDSLAQIWACLAVESMSLCRVRSCNCRYCDTQRLDKTAASGAFHLSDSEAARLATTLSCAWGYAQRRRLHRMLRCARVILTCAFILRAQHRMPLVLCQNHYRYEHATSSVSTCPQAYLLRSCSPLADGWRTCTPLSHHQQPGPPGCRCCCCLLLHA